MANKEAPGAPTGRVRWADSILCLLFPERCLLCGRLIPPASKMPLCGGCAHCFRPLGAVCPGCQAALIQVAGCLCRNKGTALEGLFALTWYSRRWRRLLHELKYGGRRSLARPLGRWLGRELADSHFTGFDLVVPVPAHRARLGERGYNQSELIARHAAVALGLPALNLIEKSRRTAAQTGLSRIQRSINVKGSFACRRGGLEGKAVILVDDIYSTGATLKEAALALKSAGAVVYGAVVAYNPLDY